MSVDTEDYMSTSYFDGVDDRQMDSMRVLSETAAEFPQAISFSSGAPFDRNYSLNDLQMCLNAYCRHVASNSEMEPALLRNLFHYSDVNGFIRQEIVDYLRIEEGLDVEVDELMMTNGFQEGLLVVLRGLKTSSADVFLCAEPVYVGVTGAARMLDIPVVGIPQGPNGITSEQVTAAVEKVNSDGGRVMGVYVNPDNSNPSGTSMPLEERHAMLNAASELEFFLIEDNPYRIFSPEAEIAPSLKSLDWDKRVISIGSFAKSVFPGARLGYVYADRLIGNDPVDAAPMAKRFSAIKSMYSVGTSSLSQAVVAGALISEEFGYRNRIDQAREAYLNRLNVTLNALEEHFPPSEVAHHGVSWTPPAGGFFVVINTAFDANFDAMRESASAFAVSWAPMRMFYTLGGGEKAIRLGFSNLTPERISEGIRRLAQFNAHLLVKQGVPHDA
ncbi:MAG: GntR family transcriptional regulator [Kocuria rhizophila]|nr:MAG: GntR family transcriptional regulator [Kocuria rhizophila]